MARAPRENNKPQYFEDYRAGDVFEFGAVVVDEAEVIEFASRFDPQSFHTSPEAAKASHFGGLIASGWHTCAMLMRMLVEHYIATESSMGSPGVDEIRWLSPVRPGDTLHARATVLEARVSQSKPDRGLIRSGIEVMNQHNDIVMTLQSVGFFLRRPLAG